MQGKLQQTYRVSQEVTRHGFFSGSIKPSQFPRLSSLVIPDQGVIRVTFEFTKNAYQHDSVKGHINAELSVECQRCLKPMEQTIDLDFDLLIDATDEDIQSFQLDSVYSDEGFLDIFEVIEDELILALPIIMMHEDISCNPYWQPESVDDQVVEKNNPFAVLESLKGHS